jgi:radical SAM protein with 4Fe4S-binding SPASM domain
VKSRRLNVMSDDYFPAYVVWELTLKCDHACAHCGSRAVKARPDELSTEEALGVVKQLAAMRAREVVLIGGEAYLHEGFIDVIRALTKAGVRAGLTTGGRGITAELAKEIADAGLYNASVSIDGMREAHDLMRSRKGSFDGATQALINLREAGVRVGTNSNFNRLNVGDLEPLYQHVKDNGSKVWQVQLTVPLGRAADRPELIFQPYELTDLLPRLAELKKRGFDEGIVILPGNNLGYFGPEEALLRSPRKGMRDHWAGCQAGKFVMGIESDGNVKGCPSLQPAYIAGSLREKSLKQIWDSDGEIAFSRKRTVDDLWGFCGTCAYAEVCMGGCSFTSHALFGRPGNNPYCHYRARTLARQGLRERIVPRSPAQGVPFDHALFDLVEEPLDADTPDALPRDELVQIRLKPTSAR